MWSARKYMRVIICSENYNKTSSSPVSEWPRVHRNIYLSDLSGSMHSVPHVPSRSVSSGVNSLEFVILYLSSNSFN